MSCKCGKPKCKGQCGCKSPAVLQINNPSTYVSFHKVTIPASMGDSTTNPPENGKYRNVLVHYDADDTSWLYSSDGIPTKITGPQGPVGPIGPAGTIEIGTTTTGESGSDASVENVGTPENAILNFTIPRGEQGEQGIQGETGPQGYMNEQDVRDVVDTIVPEDFFTGDDDDSDCGSAVILENIGQNTPVSFSLLGGSHQDVYSGVNLYNFKDTTGTPSTYITVDDEGWMTCTLSEARSSRLDANYYTHNLPLTVSTQYAVVVEVKTVSGDGKLYPYSSWTGHSEGQFTTEQSLDFSSAHGNQVFVYKPTTRASYGYDVGLRTYVRFEAGQTGSITFRISVIADTTVTTSSFRYEPYTDLVSAPSPMYPQDLQTVSGQQKIIVAGKNIFDKAHANIRSGYFAGTGVITGDTYNPYGNSNKWLFVPCAPNTTYTVTKPSTATQSNNRFRLGTTSSIPRNGDALSGFWNAGDGTATTEKTYTTAADARYLCIYYGQGTSLSDEMTDVLNGIQVEVGSEATAYEAFTSNEYTLNLGDIELAGSNDRIYKDAEGWKIHREIASMTRDVAIHALAGSTSGTDIASANGAFAILNSSWGSSYYGNTLGQGTISSNLGVLDDTQTIASDTDANAMNDGTFVQRDGTNDRVYFRNTALIGKTGLDVKALMLANSGGTNIWYPLTNQSDILISDPNLVEQLEAIRLNSGLNNVFLSNDNDLGTVCLGGLTDGWGGTVERIDSELSKINEKIDDNVHYIFPKFWDTAYSGDCNLIKYQGNVILIDSHSSGQWTNVKEMLDSNDATHIDIFILTHYHGDHNGNVNNLVNNGYIDSDTMVYLPAPVETFGDSFITANANTRANFDAHDIPYRTPNEGERIQIGDELYFTFLNCDKDIIDAYPVKYQNSVSMCTFVEYRNTRAFFSGDSGQAVYKRLREAGYPKYRVDLYKMGHHGIDQRTDPQFVRLLSPYLAVQPSGIKDFVKNNFGICEDAAVLKEIGAKIFPYHMQRDYIRIDSDGSNTECISGQVFGSSDQRIVLTYYVDKSVSTSAYQDGTEDYPFSELMQAISSIPFKNATDVTINVAAGYYGNAHESEGQKNQIFINTNRDVRITINGDSEDNSAVVLNHVRVIDGHVKFNNLTIDVDNGDALYILSSYVSLDNVVIKSNTDTQSTAYSGIILRDRSYVVASNLRITQVNEGIIASQGSKFFANGPVSIGTHNSNIANMSRDSELITGSNFSFDSITDKETFKLYGTITRLPVGIMSSHADFAQTVNLVVNASELMWIEIFYKTDDGRYGSTGRIYSPNNRHIGALVPYLSADGTAVYNKQCNFHVNGTSISIVQSLQIKYENGAYPVIQTGTSYFNILAVIGGYQSGYLNVAS